MAARNPVTKEVVAPRIVTNPNIAHGRPHIAHRRIRVQDVAVWYEQMGMSTDEIADQFELTLGEIHTALAYYYDHRAEIQNDLEEDDKFVKEAKKHFKSKIPANLKRARG